MRALSLFSGIAGLDRAAHAAGIETVAFCEIEPFACRIQNWCEVMRKESEEVEA